MPPTRILPRVILVRAFIARVTARSPIRSQTNFTCSYDLGMNNCNVKGDSKTAIALLEFGGYWVIVN